MRGRLKKCLSAWLEIGTPTFILDIIRDGYKIPFVHLPLPKLATNNLSALNHKAFVNSEIGNFLYVNCIEELANRPLNLNPLSVKVQNCVRLILYLRHVNLFIYKQKFKGFKQLKQILDKEDFLFKSDLKSGYHHVEIFEPHIKYLAFAWDFRDGHIRYFQFCVLPSAPFIFTKLLKQHLNSLSSSSQRRSAGPGISTIYHKPLVN